MTLEELRDWLWADTDEQQMAVLGAVFTRLNQPMPAAAVLPPRVRIMSMHGAKGFRRASYLYPDWRSTFSPALGGSPIQALYSKQPGSSTFPSPEPARRASLVTQRKDEYKVHARDSRFAFHSKP